jgi:hypothetical protein
VTTLRPGEETYLERGNDGETNAYKDGKSQEMTYTLLLILTVCGRNIRYSKL